jgi:2-C-methyl-D-erythritol 4-phosphate cytidylyltransferase
MSVSGLSLALVVAAAGYGTRLNSGLPKQYVPILGIPMLQRTLSSLTSCEAIDALVVVVNPEDVEYCGSEIAHEQLGQKIVSIVAGGAERGFSVRNGLAALAQAGRGIWLGCMTAPAPWSPVARL